MDTLSRRDTLLPRMYPVPHFPVPGAVPVLPTEEDLAKVEKRLEQTQNRDRSTRRPGLRSDKPNIKRTMRKLEQAIASGRLGERDMYDAIVNLHLLKRSLEGQKNAAVRAFENSLLVHRIVARFIR